MFRVIGCAGTTSADHGDCSPLQPKAPAAIEASAAQPGDPPTLVVADAASLGEEQAPQLGLRNETGDLSNDGAQRPQRKMPVNGNGQHLPLARGQGPDQLRMAPARVDDVEAELPQGRQGLAGRQPPHPGHHEATDADS